MSSTTSINSNSNSTPEKSTSRTEKIHVLFGSQTGNSEQAAQDFCRQAVQQLSPTAIQKLTGTSNVIHIETVCQQLDDFLELHYGAWTRCTVIFTSSYGVGQAPLGCYRFRELCDAWHEQYNDNKDNDKPKILQGFSYALCGLGDSKYTTFFQNPTRIDKALTCVGATRVGPLGKCDASGTGNDEQDKAIARWKDEIWSHVASVVVQPPMDESQTKAAQEATIALCRQINPDFVPPPSQQQSWLTQYANVVSVLLVALVAIALAFYWQA